MQNNILTALITAGAGFLGACLALAGVVVTTFFKNRHDLRLAREQREMALRKEILLEIAGTLSTGTNYLLAHARLDVSLDQVAKDNDLDGIQATFGKMLLVATNDTINAVTEANMYVAQAITQLATSLENVKEIKAQYDAEFTADPTSVKTAGARLTFHETNLDHLELCFRVTRDAQPLIQNAIICARRELSSYDTQAFDEGRFRMDQEASGKKVLDNLLAFIDENRIIKTIPDGQGHKDKA